MKIDVSGGKVVRSVYVRMLKIGLEVIINTYEKGCYISFDSGSYGLDIKDMKRELGIMDGDDGSDLTNEEVITLVPESEHESNLLGCPRWEQHCKDQMILLYVDTNYLKEEYLDSWEAK